MRTLPTPHDRQIHATIVGTGQFFEEDRGEEFTPVVATFIEAKPVLTTTGASS